MDANLISVDVVTMAQRVERPIVRLVDSSRNM
jgi:hypothetical protein